MMGSTPNNRIALWNSLLDSDMNVIYWGMISDRYSKWDRRTKILVAIAAPSGTVAAWGIWSAHPQAWHLLLGVASIASIGQAFLCSPERLTKMASLVATWRELRTDYELLWQRDSNLQSSNSWDQFEAARRREGKVDETGMPKNGKLRQEAYNEVCRKRGLDVPRKKT